MTAHCRSARAVVHAEIADRGSQSRVWASGRLGVWDGVKARKTRCLEAWRRRKRGCGGIYRFFSVPWLRRCCRLDFLLGLLGQKSASFRVPAKHNPNVLGESAAIGARTLPRPLWLSAGLSTVSARSCPLSAPLNSMPGAHPPLVSPGPSPVVGLRAVATADDSPM